MSPECPETYEAGYAVGLGLRDDGKPLTANSPAEYIAGMFAGGYKRNLTEILQRPTSVPKTLDELQPMTLFPYDP